MAGNALSYIFQHGGPLTNRPALVRMRITITAYKYIKPISPIQCLLTLGTFVTSGCREINWLGRQ